jgi:hypothetical protein
LILVFLYVAQKLLNILAQMPTKNVSICTPAYAVPA